jgi:hypothetical protein
MPHWEDPVKGQRPSQRAATNGYPFGFAKSQWLLRDRLLAQMQLLSARKHASEQMEDAAGHEAIARALDWERLLGSFNHAGEDRFPVTTINAVASNLIAWLSYQGFQVVRNDEEQEEPLPIAESKFPVVFDNARKILVLLPEEALTWGHDDEHKGGGTGAFQLASPQDSQAVTRRTSLLARFRGFREYGAKEE